MTREEAQALVLREGMMTEPVPDDAMAMLLHSGDEPDEHHLGRLMQALWTLSQDLKGQVVLDRKLAAALWVLGAETTTYLSIDAKRTHPAEEAASRNIEGIIDLMTAVESVFLDAWLLSNCSKGGTENGDSTA